jgi:penicillin-binding protein 1C
MTLSRDEKDAASPARSHFAAARAGGLPHEDRFFGEHPGVNPVAVLRAAVLLRERRGGASDHNAIGAAPIAPPDAHCGANSPRCCGLELERTTASAVARAYLDLAPYGATSKARRRQQIYFGKEPRSSPGTRQ